MNNLYIIKSVLSNYTEGLAVIVAPSMERCRELFKEEFATFWAQRALGRMNEFDSAVEQEKFYVIEGINHDEGIIDYVYGGG